MRCLELQYELQFLCQQQKILFLRTFLKICFQYFADGWFSSSTASRQVYSLSPFLTSIFPGGLGLTGICLHSGFYYI